MFQKIENHKFLYSIDLAPQAESSSFIHEQFSGHTLTFTDGFKSLFGIEPAFWILSTSHSCLLSFPPFPSIFHAEQVAILKLSEYIKQNHSSGSFLVASDSLSAFQVFSSTFSLSSQSVAFYITTLLSYLSSTNFHFFVYPATLKSHTMIESMALPNGQSLRAHPSKSYPSGKFFILFINLLMMTGT